MMKDIKYLLSYILYKSYSSKAVGKAGRRGFWTGGVGLGAQGSRLLYEHTARSTYLKFSPFNHL